MAKEITTSEILMLINERDKHTQDKFDVIADSLAKVCNHMIVSEEDKRHDADFKKEVRTHIKFAEPILFKAKDHQALRAKVAIGVVSFLILGVLGAFFKFN
jgi:hypothetical protein